MGPAAFGPGNCEGRKISAAEINALKRAAALRAVEFVEPGMKVGLGTGSTVDLFLDLLAERVRGGLQMLGTPTSKRTETKARNLGIALADLDDLQHLDVVVDGADEVDPRLDLIKGGGGALLREKIVAASASRMVVIVDESKLKTRLGSFPLPVEVVRFGHKTTKARILAAAGELGYRKLEPVLRRNPEGDAYITDNGNCIYDCPFGRIDDAATLAASLSTVVGVVEHGLFCGMASCALVAGNHGVRVLERPSA